MCQPSVCPYGAQVCRPVTRPFLCAPATSGRVAECVVPGGWPRAGTPAHMHNPYHFQDVVIHTLCLNSLIFFHCKCVTCSLKRKKKKTTAHGEGKESAQLSISSILMSFQTYPQFFNINLFLIILFILPVLGLCCCVGISIVEVSGGYSLVAVPRLFTVVASLVAEHGL